jgi:hypothetical protein
MTPGSLVFGLQRFGELFHHAPYRHRRHTISTLAASLRDHFTLQLTAVK